MMTCETLRTLETQYSNFLRAPIELEPGRQSGTLRTFKLGRLNEMSDKFRKRLIFVLRLVGGLFLLAWFGYADNLNWKLPRIPNETVGRVFPIPFHGTDGYADQTQYLLFWATFFIGILLFLIASWVGIRGNKQKV